MGTEKCSNTQTMKYNKQTNAQTHKRRNTRNRQIQPKQEGLFLLMKLTSDGEDSNNLKQPKATNKQMERIIQQTNKCSNIQTKKYNKQTKAQTHKQRNTRNRQRQPKQEGLF